MLYKFYPREPYAVAFADLLQFHDTKITALPIGIALREIIAQLLHDARILDAARDEAAAREILLLRGGDQLFNHRAHFFRARLGRLDLLRADHVVRQIPQKRNAVTAETIEFSSLLSHDSWTILLSSFCFLFRLFARRSSEDRIPVRDTADTLSKWSFKNIRRFMERRRRAHRSVGSDLNAQTVIIGSVADAHIFRKLKI